ncbi:MAG: InlB B-repeat-containing protein [Faecalicoccus sp.]|nr:InlB B-repeat-containing protein [Faecalicoccus sp.]
MKKKWIRFALVLLIALIPFGSKAVHAQGELFTVSFAPGTGTGSMAPVSVEAGAQYELPRCAFTHTNPERNFYMWMVDGMLMFPGDYITVNTDTTVTAVWYYSRAQRIDNSVDRSTSEVIGYLVMRDTGTGETYTEVVFDEVTASEFTQPSNPTVNAMISEAQDALSQKAEEYSGKGTVTVIDKTISDPTITKTIDNRTYSLFDTNLDEAGDYFSYLIIDGEFWHNWQYSVTLEVEYESQDVPDLSSLHILPGTGGSFLVDFDGKQSDDQPWQMPEGTEITVTAVPEDGYHFKSWYKGDVNGATYEEMVTDELLSSNEVYSFSINGDLYLCPVFEINAGPVHPGDQVQMWVGNTEVVGPDSSAQGGKVAVKYTPSYDDFPDIQAKDGTDFVAGEILPFYKGDSCTVYAQADPGYRFVGWYHVNIEWGPGATLAWEGSVISTDASFTYKPGETIIEGDSEPLRYVCAVFEKAPDELETFTVSFDANSGAGTMDPVSVNANEGFILPECGFTAPEGKEFAGWDLGPVGSVITITADTTIKAEWKDIPPVSLEYHITEGQNGIWQKGRNTGLNFTIIRTIDNESALSHFTGVEVDGVSISKENYTVTSGGIKLSLKSSYLETLSVGRHTLKVVFDDGMAETQFTITTAGTPEKSDSKNRPQTGHETNLGFWMSLMLISFVTVMGLFTRRKA